MEALEAGRGDDEARQRAALAELDAAREEMGCVGGLLLLMALEHGGLVVQKKLGRVFGGLGVEAYEKAVRAAACVAELTAELDALRCEVKELTRRLERKAELRLVR
jgi:hypothetical protein